MLQFWLKLAATVSLDFTDHSPIVEVICNPKRGTVKEEVRWNCEHLVETNSLEFFHLLLDREFRREAFDTRSAVEAINTRGLL